MTNNELRTQFDTLINAYYQNVNYGEEQGRRDYSFDDYEKSVFLTSAQEDITKTLYKSFEQNESIREYLNTLIKTHEETNPVNHTYGLTSNSYSVKLPVDMLALLYEGVVFNTNSAVNTQYGATKLSDDDKCLAADITNNASIASNNVLYGNYAEVVPVTLDELYRILNNPFKGPSKKRVLRIEKDKEIVDGISYRSVELISKYPIAKYAFRYISYPSPIILINLPDGLKIHGVSTETPPSLPDVLHEELLKMAVQLALQSRVTKSSKED